MELSVSTVGLSMPTVTLSSPTAALTKALKSAQILYTPALCPSYTSPKATSPVRAKSQTTSVHTLVNATEKKSTPTQTFVDTLSEGLYTLSLFVYSDVKTVLVPWALFGIAHAISAPVLGMKTSSTTISILSHLPRVFCWLLINLLPFTIGNQRHPSAILEDSVNKAWRPIPSKRITVEGARSLMIASYFAAFLFSLLSGGTSQCVFLALLGYLYNDLGGGEKSWVSRNLLNGLGFISFGSGAMEVALGQSVMYSALLTQWLRILILVVFTGIHTHDMYDQAGDAMTKRNTLPLVIGDEAARWTIMVSVLAWSIFCPWFWQTGAGGYLLILCGGLTVAWRTFTKRTVKQDKKTCKIWNLWLAAVYCLPLLSFVRHTVA